VDPASERQELLRRVLAIGGTLVNERDPAAVLDRILAEAQSLTGARYAALGVLDEARVELERFITAGFAESTKRSIGDLPRGRGVLGVLIHDPRPQRLTDVGAHPESYGFPPGHPPMHSFLGVPIIIRGQAWGNLYLTEKENAEPFSDQDEEAVTILAGWAATAIDNARLFEANRQRRTELERSVQALEAARDIADAVGEVGELDRVLELVAKRGRALVEARTLLIMVRDGDELLVSASAGHGMQAQGQRLPIHGSSAGHVFEHGAPERFDDVATELKIAPADFGVPNAHSGLTVPLQHRGTAIGVLVAFDRGDEKAPFTADDESVLRTFAASAANAIALNRSVAADRLRSAITAAEAERGRWARELHDQTLQSLGALRVGLASIRRGANDETIQEALTETIADVETEIANLRAIIADLRPAILDDLGLEEALDALLDRHQAAGLTITRAIDLDGHLDAGRRDPGAETTVYRLVQEALTNIVKHARASEVRVGVATSSEDDTMTVEISDDGVGFDADRPSGGFGLAGLRERVFLAGGKLELTSSPAGTRITARLPGGSNAAS
jgi:signal transduction histidine kinase